MNDDNPVREMGQTLKSNELALTPSNKSARLEYKCSIYSPKL